MAGGVVVPVHSYIPTPIHIPAQEGGTLMLGLETTSEDRGPAPYPVHGVPGPGPGMEES